ncbi:MAG: GTPase Era [Chloroflexota bacterium]
MITSDVSGVLTEAPFRAGFVALVGRANVGKSTLLNALVGQHLAIVSPKPHTTRHKLLGALNGPGFQAGLLDTPGYLRGQRDQMDALMRGALAEALAEADLVVLVAEPRPPGDVEQQMMARIADSGTPALCVLNKTDTAKRPALLPVMAAYAEAHPFAEIIPVSAATEDGIERLGDLLAAHLPEREGPLFPPDTLTDRPVRFLCAELVREQVFARFGHEVPYEVAVEVDTYEEREGTEPDLVEATITVDRPSQKAMLIGARGEALKEIGTGARVAIEELVGRPVYLRLWVKVTPKWRRKAGFVQRLR